MTPDGYSHLPLDNAANRERREPHLPDRSEPQERLVRGHDEGGRAWRRIASLIETAKINGVEPFAYCKATHEAVVDGQPKAAIDDLLPWKFKPSS